MKVEEFIVDTAIKDLIAEKNGKLYIEEKAIKKLDFNIYEKRCLDKILTEKNITIKKNKSPRKSVRNYSYGEKEIFDGNKKRRNFHTKIEYSTSGEIIMTDFKELDSYLENNFIPRCLKYKTETNSLVSDEKLKYIRLKDMAELNLSDVETEHVMNYLQSKNINVNGCSTSLSGYFENYNQSYNNSSYKIKRPKPLSKEEQSKLFEEYRKTKNKEIKDKIIEHNLRFVAALSCKYAFATGIEQEDLESYGFLGLIKAIDNYDPTKGEFLTIAKFYIMGSIIEGIAQFQGYKVSEFYYDYNVARKQVEKKRGELLKENLDLVDEIVDNLIEKNKISEKHREENKTRIMLGHVMFFDDVLEEKLIDDNTLYNEALENVQNQQLKQTLNSVLECLTDKEKEVVIKRFGLDDGEEKTLDIIGKELNITKQAVSSREKSALQKIRKSRKLSILKDFYDNESIDYSYDPKGLVKIKK